MPLRKTHNARRYNERITLTFAEAVGDEFGHASLSEPVAVLDVYAYVRQMSATKVMQTFQQADVVGLDIEFRRPSDLFNGITYRGHDVHFSEMEDVDGRGRIVRVSGWYQKDNPDVR